VFCEGCTVVLGAVVFGGAEMLVVAFNVDVLVARMVELLGLTVLVEVVEEVIVVELAVEVMLVLLDVAVVVAGGVL